ncbi:MAG: sodium:proton antiporter [Pseudomonadota bacterium]
MENLIFGFAIIGVLGVGAQWVAWRFNLPGIVLMSIAGVIAGPVTGFLWPAGYDPSTASAPPMETLFGDFYKPIIGVAVAVILFEGGLTLNFSEIKDFGKSVRRLVFPGAPLAWGLGSLAGRFIGGLTWEASILFGGIMVVTGPTVIVPLLRQAKLKQRPAALLKWEGIVNDPLGALFAVFAYEIVTLDFSATFTNAAVHSPTDLIGALIIGSALAAGWGFALGRGTAHVFHRGWAPEYLKPPLLLVLVLLCFEVANLLQEEAGLVAVTAMGVTIANSRIASINELRLFKENAAVLLVSGVFVILTANLTPSTLGAIDTRAILLILAMLFVVRPIAIMLSTIGAGLSVKERILISWIAPRGIVAVAVTSFFGAAMVSHFADVTTGLDASAKAAALTQIESAQKLIPLAFAMVFSTVVLHGFTIGPLARLLGLSFTDRPGVLISGASNWSIAFAEKLVEMEVPVVLADTSWRRLAPARLANIPTYYGEILSEVTEHHLDLNRFGVLIAISSNEAHNALVCTDLAPEMGRAAIYQVNARGKDEEDRRALSYTLQGRTFLHNATPLDVLQRRMFAGWTFQRTRISSAYPPEQYLSDLGDEREIILVVRRGEVIVASEEAPILLAEDDRVLAFALKQASKQKAAATPTKSASEVKGRDNNATLPNSPLEPLLSSINKSESVSE